MRGAEYLPGQLLSLIFYIMTLVVYNRARREYAGGKIAAAINLIMMFLAILLIADSLDYFLQIIISVGDDTKLIIKILLKLVALSVLFFGGLRFFSKQTPGVPAGHDVSMAESLGQGAIPLAEEAAAVHQYPSGTAEDLKKTQPTLGRYEIIEQIGQGAMGIVYRGRDPKLQRLTAIKTIRFIDDYDEDKIEKIKSHFYHEAEIVARLTHRNIVKIYDVGEDLDLSYLAMEHLEGDSLESHCQADRLLPVHRTFDIIAQVCDALDYAHSHGIVHRDIKPGNIMVLNDGEVKVTDFGIARAADSTKTRTGIIKGTPYYMSPEQARGEKLDGRADIFSLGVVFYHALTGKLPFTGDSLAAIVYQAANTDPPPASDYNRDVGQAVIAILDKAMAKDAQDRFQSAGQMAEALRSLYAGADAKLRKAGLADKAVAKPQGDAAADTEGHASVTKAGSGNYEISSSLPKLTPEVQFRSAGRSEDAAIANKKDGPRLVRSAAGRFAIYLAAGIFLLGGLGAGYILLGKKQEAVNREQMLAEQKALAAKILQEKIKERKRLADEEARKQKALQAELAEKARQKEEQQRAVRQKLEAARLKQEADRKGRATMEKQQEQVRLEALRREKEQEEARLEAEEAERKAEAERIAEAERKKSAARMQQDIKEVEEHMLTADTLRRERRFQEARDAYEAALAVVTSSSFHEDSRLVSFRNEIESILTDDDIVYGSKGYVLHKGRWLSPEELELARYSEGFVKYKGAFRDHRTLKPTINKLCDPLIQKYLKQKYSGQTVHTKNIYFQKMILTRNNAEFSQYAVYYKWAISTFKGLDEDICIMDIKYTVETGKWSLLKGCE